MKKRKTPPKTTSSATASAPVPTAPSRTGTVGKKIALALVMPVLVLGLAEGALRVSGFQHTPREKVLWKPTVSGFIGTYEFYIQTELSPPGYIWLSQPNTPYTDRYGFRLPEIPYQKPADKVRVAFLGGSTTHGGYRPYPERAIRIINQAIGTNRYEMLNVACSSYSTHQSVKALDRWVLPRKPDIAFVYHGWNDAFLAVDGHADREKDALLGAGGKARLTMPAFVRNLKLTAFLANMAESAGGPWPRQRVAPADFEANLEAMAAACASNQVRMIVMARPEQRRADLVIEPLPADSALGQFARAVHQTDDYATLYARQAAEITTRQRSLAERHPHVDLCDGWSTVSNLLERAGRGEFGENVHVFHADNCHLYDFADELLAQEVALSIAPEHAEAIRAYLDSIPYLKGIAEELLRETAPREAAWFAREALARATDESERAALEAIVRQAEADFEFADLFRTGRWGGTDQDFDSKIRKLTRCLELRPDDYGVMTQIYRVCIYMNRLEVAAPALARFSPRTPQQRYEWLQFTMESHLQGKRWGPARRAAEQLAQMNPQHPVAQSVLQQIPADVP